MSEFKMPDIGSLMQTAQRLQSEMARVQQELARRECEASAGGGMVTVALNGHFEMTRLSIEKTVVDPNDITMLEDLIKAAVNQAVAKVREMSQSEMSKLTGGMGIPMPGVF
jgi:DNA-binding YbaB/EbfC family protein